QDAGEAGRPGLGRREIRRRPRKTQNRETEAPTLSCPRSAWAPEATRFYSLCFLPCLSCLSWFALSPWLPLALDTSGNPDYKPALRTVVNREVLMPSVWRWRILAGLLILGSAGLHVSYLSGNCPLDLGQDEAHYWDWSRHLDWSYYSKGPLVA